MTNLLGLEQSYLPGATDNKQVCYQMLIWGDRQQATVLQATAVVYIFLALIIEGGRPGQSTKYGFPVSTLRPDNMFTLPVTKQQR